MLPWITSKSWSFKVKWNCWGLLRWSSGMTPWHLDTSGCTDRGTAGNSFSSSGNKKSCLSVSSNAVIWFYARLWKEEDRRQMNDVETFPSGIKDDPYLETVAWFRLLPDHIQHWVNQLGSWKIKYDYFWILINFLRWFHCWQGYCVTDWYWVIVEIISDSMHHWHWQVIFN